MRERGSRDVEDGVDRVGRRLRRLSGETKEADRNVNLFSRGLTMLGTRAGMFAILGAAAVATAGVFSPAVLAMTAGVVAFSAAFAPAIFIAAGVVQRFQDTAGIAGSAASELSDVLFELKHAFNVAVSPAAAIVMRSISEALVMMLEPLQAMRGPLTVFARAMGQAIEGTAAGLVQLAPAMADLITRLAPELPRIAEAAVLLFDALLQIAKYGVPVFHDMLTGLIAFSKWLGPAIDDMARWASVNMHISSTAWAAVAGTVEWLAQVMWQLFGVAKQLFVAMEPVSALIGGSLLWGLVAVLDALTWLNSNFSTGSVVVGVFANAILAYFVAMRLATVATAAYKVALIGAKGVMLAVTALQWAAWWIALARAEGIAATAQLALNVAMSANPIALVVIALAALTAGLVYAYMKVSWFREAVNSAWQVLRWTPLGMVIGLLTNFEGTVSRVKGVAVTAFGAIKTAVQWVIDKVEWLIQKISAIKLPDLTPWSGLLPDLTPWDGLLPGRADGGPVARGGAYVVGERGPELFVPRQSGTIAPNPALAAPTGAGAPEEFVIDATFVMPDGEVTARQTVRAAKKKKSMR